MGYCTIKDFEGKILNGTHDWQFAQMKPDENKICFVCDCGLIKKVEVIE